MELNSLVGLRFANVFSFEVQKENAINVNINSFLLF